MKKCVCQNYENSQVPHISWQHSITLSGKDFCGYIKVFQTYIKHSTKDMLLLYIWLGDLPTLRPCKFLTTL